MKIEHTENAKRIARRITADARFTVGQKVLMSQEALDNYGQEFEGIVLIITSKSTAYMPAKEFYSSGMPKGFHPGYDEGVGGGLYDLKRADDSLALDFSLYDWELIRSRNKVRIPAPESGPSSSPVTPDNSDTDRGHPSPV